MTEATHRHECKYCHLDFPNLRDLGAHQTTAMCYAYALHRLAELNARDGVS